MIWKPCPGFEAFYEVSDQGEVRGIAKRAVKGRGAIVGLVLRQTTAPDGYRKVTLRAPGRRSTKRVHRIVCEAFHGPQPTPAHEVAHGNGDRADNRAQNLRWATRLENIADKRLHGTENIGSRSGKAKLTEADVIAIRQRAAEGVMHKVIARDYPVCSSQISHIVAGDNWRHV